MIRDTLVFVFVSLAAFSPIVTLKAMGGFQSTEVSQPAFVVDLPDGVPAIIQDVPATPIVAPPAAPSATSMFYGAGFDAIVGILLTGATGLVGWLSMWWRTLFRADMDEKMRSVLHEGLRNGILFAAARIKAKVEAGLNVDIQSELLANTNQYMNDRSPEVLKYFSLQGKPPEALKDLVAVNAAKLNLSMKTADRV